MNTNTGHVSRHSRGPIAWLTAVCICLHLASISTAQPPGPYELSGFTPDEIFNIQDERPLLSSAPHLARLRDRSTKASQIAMDRFNEMTGPVDLNQLLFNPREFRCNVVEISGVAKLARRIDPNASDADVSQSFYIVQIEDFENQSAIICLNEIPVSWPLNETIDQPIRAQGFYLANFDFHDAKIEDQITVPELDTYAPVVVAKRLNWYPDIANSNVAVSPSQLLLAKHAVDIADLLQTRNNGRLTAEDSPTFYQMLSACKKIKDAGAGESPHFTDCLKQPKKHLGDAIQIRGQLRSATKIQIENPKVIHQLGQDHYYQVVVFASLDRQQIVIRNPRASAKSDSKQSADAAIVHENRYPIIVCTPALPKPESEMERQQVAVSGFFLKLWNYESGHSDRNVEAPKQISPLIIALPPAILTQDTNSLNFWIAVLAAGFLIICGLLIYSGNQERRLKKTAPGTNNLPDQIEIPAID